MEISKNNKDKGNIKIAEIMSYDPRKETRYVGKRWMLNPRSRVKLSLKELKDKKGTIIVRFTFNDSKEPLIIFLDKFTLFLLSLLEMKNSYSSRMKTFEYIVRENISSKKNKLKYIYDICEWVVTNKKDKNTEKLIKSKYPDLSDEKTITKLLNDYFMIEDELLISLLYPLNIILPYKGKNKKGKKK